MDYLKLLENSFLLDGDFSECPPPSKLCYLADSIFDFTTYDSGMSDLFGQKAIEVCKAINNGTTFEYIESEEDYKWYLLMVNMPFFYTKLSWGSSIRGAWWDIPSKGELILESCGIWGEDRKQIMEIKFDLDQWKQFIDALIVWSERK